MVDLLADNSLAGVMEEMGYLATASKAAFSALLDHFPRPGGTLPSLTALGDGIGSRDALILRQILKF